MSDFKELVRQRLMLLKMGAATKSLEETASDIIALVVEECAVKAESCAPKYQDLMGEAQRGTVKRISSEIRKLAL